VAHAKPSGVDPAICLKDGLVRFVRAGHRPQVSRMKMKNPAHLVVASAGGHGGTRESVTRLAEMRISTPKLVEQAMQTLGETARVGGQALTSGDLETAGLAMDLANGVLSGFGLVAPGVAQGLAICRGAGALGAKMSGAGGRGGAFCALFDGVRRARRGVNLLNEAGYLAWIERIND
ncbi:MAG: mevalonate kinase, partial [Myxococcota bacterium]